MIPTWNLVVTVSLICCKTWNADCSWMLSAEYEHHLKTCQHSRKICRVSYFCHIVRAFLNAEDITCLCTCKRAARREVPKMNIPWKFLPRSRQGLWFHEWHCDHPPSHFWPRKTSVPWSRSLSGGERSLVLSGNISFKKFISRCSFSHVELRVSFRNVEI